MDPIIMAAVVAAGLALGTAAWLLMSGTGKAAKRAVSENLKRGTAAMTLPAAPLQSAVERSGTQSLLLKFTPQGWTEKIAGKLARSGVDSNITPDKVVLAKLGMAGFIAFFFFVMASKTGMPLLWLGIPFGALGGFFLPELLIYNTALKRREAIDLELPDILDQMSVAVSAGLGFESALMRVAMNAKGSLPPEFIRTLQDIQMGMSRKMAFQDLADRTGSEYLTRFTRSIISAETHGLPLTHVLKTQADELRDIRRQNAEKQAAQIPVKVTFPMMVGILPVLFIVVLGPAAINIVGMFSAM